MTATPTETQNLWHFFKGAPLRTKLRLVGLGLLGLAVAGAGGSAVAFVLHWSGAVAKPDPVAAAAAPAPPPAPEFAFHSEIKDVSLAFTSRDFSRTSYAQFTLVLDCPTAEAKHVLEMNRAKVLDALFEVASDFRLEDFQTPDGVRSFKAKLKEKFDETLGDAAPRRVAMADWLLQ